MPPHTRTRPTTDRTREALFSTLATWVGAAGSDEPLAGYAFLDLFGGSGAVGLEAASRGARPVLIVESDRRTAEIARRNAASTGLDVSVRADRAERVIAEPILAEQHMARFDVVWLDPPYDVPTAAVDALVADLVAHGRVAGDGLVVVERSGRSAPVSFPEGWESWHRRYGETTLYYAQAARDGAPPDPPGEEPR